MKRILRRVALWFRFTEKGAALVMAASILVHEVSELLSTIHSLFK